MEEQFKRYSFITKTHNSVQCFLEGLNLFFENVDFERFFAPKRFFLNTSTNDVVFDNFLLISQNHNFVSKVEIDCEWNAQMHLLSNGKLVEMETLSPRGPRRVYPWTPKKGDL